MNRFNLVTTFSKTNGLVDPPSVITNTTSALSTFDWTEFAFLSTFPRTKLSALSVYVFPPSHGKFRTVEKNSFLLRKLYSLAWSAYVITDADTRLKSSCKLSLSSVTKRSSFLKFVSVLRLHELSRTKTISNSSLHSTIKIHYRHEYMY